MTLQDLLEANPANDLRIGHNGEVNGKPAIIIHPANVDGETLDFVVNGDSLEPNPNVTKAA